jgi:hypothetical protein
MKVLKNTMLALIVIIMTSFIPRDKTCEVDDVIHTVMNYQTYDTQVHTSWKLSGSGYWRESNGYSIYNDFEYAISRSIYPINGYYYYDFWFFSQSYYWDGYTQHWAATNMMNVDVYVDNQHVTSDYSTLGITFSGKEYNATSLRFYTKNPNAKIYFKWGGMKAK